MIGLQTDFLVYHIDNGCIWGMNVLSKGKSIKQKSRGQGKNFISEQKISKEQS